VVGTLVLTLGGKLKFLLPLLKFIGPALKTGGTMLFSIGVYTLVFGWRFAVGFVLLIFVHEMGHVFAARQAGIAVSAPTFIPFIGAHILLKQAMPGAWVEAKIGYGGPLAGAWASALCHWVWLETGNPIWAALAYTGYFLNLFNLAPISPLDGGRITAAISPWLWIVGYALLGGWLGLRLYRAATGTDSLSTGVFLMGMILVLGFPRLLTLFRAQSAEERRYFTVPLRQRLGMSLAYFGLIAALAYGMTLTHLNPEGLR
jgi:Zn-dependent protease